ncbi:MAG: flagellar biosynthetic protein FliO, partial [Candidatus Hydrogenedentes bacterium]|nr:flagellar biosynthetic protein FliO [Candidatus Hydrogenedentota bacterium]
RLWARRIGRDSKRAMMMGRRNKHSVFPLLALFLCGCAFAASGQQQESHEAAVTAEGEEYNEYESIPAPNVKLGSDVFPEISEEPVPETAEAGEDTSVQEDERITESETDPLISEVNRELDARQHAEEDAAGKMGARGESHSTSYSLLKAFGWLLVVVALILLVYYILQRRSSGGRLLTGNRLGTVLGRLYLNPRVCLHFVRTGGKVLVIGQSQNALSLIAGFNEADFAPVAEESGGGKEAEESETAAPAGRSFFSELRANLTAFNRRPEDELHKLSSTSLDENDIAALREDIDRLQEYLRDSTRESEH